MKYKIINICFLFLFLFSFSSCGKVVVEEEIEYGDIDESTQFVVEEKEDVSLTERVDPIDITKYFSKIPISIVEDVSVLELKDEVGLPHMVSRIKIGNDYFDMNDFLSGERTVEIKDDIFQVTLGSLNVKMAQVYSGNSLLVEENEAYGSEINGIIQEYYDIYYDTGKTFKEYGGFYTYPGYVDYMKNNSELLYNIEMYSEDQCLELIKKTFGIGEVDVICLDSEEASNLYSSRRYWQYKQGNEHIYLTYRVNTNGVYVFMYTYNDTDGELKYNPMMTFNLAQNKYYD